MIGGFITEGGNGSTEVIVRALGPTLSNFGVANALADPTLELRIGSRVCQTVLDREMSQQPGRPHPTTHQTIDRSS
jgi:hypothetical protein